MNTDFLTMVNLVVAIVQVLTLIALIIYVVKTWEMAAATKRSAEMAEKTLQEMKATREDETAPHVVVYFDVPHGKRWIYLAVKNVGRGVAENVRIEFLPPLRNTDGAELGFARFVTDGVGSIPPGYEIRTLFDVTTQYFNNKEFPLSYRAKVSYSDGSNGRARNAEYILDLSGFKGRIWVDERGMDEIAREVEEIAKSANQIQRELKSIAENLAEARAEK